MDTSVSLNVWFPSLFNAVSIQMQVWLWGKFFNPARTCLFDKALLIPFHLPVHLPSKYTHAHTYATDPCNLQEAVDKIGLAVAAEDWPLPDRSLPTYFGRSCGVIAQSLRILFGQQRAYRHRAANEERARLPHSTEVHNLCVYPDSN